MVAGAVTTVTTVAVTVAGVVPIATMVESVPVGFGRLGQPSYHTSLGHTTLSHTPLLLWSTMRATTASV